MNVHQSSLVLAHWGELTLWTLQMTTVMILSANQQLAASSSVFMQ